MGIKRFSLTALPAASVTAMFIGPAVDMPCSSGVYHVFGASTVAGGPIHPVCETCPDPGSETCLTTNHKEPEALSKSKSGLMNLGRSSSVRNKVKGWLRPNRYRRRSLLDYYQAKAEWNESEISLTEHTKTP